jgi:hypothetical protein
MGPKIAVYQATITVRAREGDQDLARPVELDVIEKRLEDAVEGVFKDEQFIFTDVNVSATRIDR